MHNALSNTRVQEETINSDMSGHCAQAFAAHLGMG
jgi:hypothetical protein